MNQNQFYQLEKKPAEQKAGSPRGKNFVVIKGVIFAGAVGLLLHQAIFNSWFWHDRLYNLNYQPPKNVVEISRQIGLQDDALQIFYASRPEIQPKEKFSQNCSSRLEKTSVLGCYKDDKIYVFDVENSELDGIEQVTAAHEFLHAAWRRMSDGERRWLGEKLRAEYERLKTPEFEKTMAGYAITQPGEHENEIHSIIGTEHAKISAELEAHYAKFFKNRQRVVEFYQKYNHKFKELEQKIEKLQAEIEARKERIERQRRNYDEDLAQYNRRVDNFNYRATVGDFDSQADFSAQRRSLIVQASSLDVARHNLSTEIDQINKLIDEFNTLASRSQNLYQSIDSNLETPKE